jgi:ribose/xylose/arabinose/galactoside ABC-type transport system permease subunit
MSNQTDQQVGDSFSRRLAAMPFVWPVALLSAYLLCIWIFVPVFFSPANLVSVTYSASLLAPAILGVHLLLLLGLFDLSIGAVAALSGTVCAILMVHGAPVSASIAAGLAAGCLFGVLNSVIVSSLGISALVGTLVTMGIARAAALGFTEGRVVSNLPDSFQGMAAVRVGDVPLLCLFVLGSVALVEFFERRHVIFRRFYHVGGSREAARNSGINVRGIEWLAFLIAGGGAALTGILQVSRSNTASPSVFGDLALDAIAACVIGGTGLQGGVGRGFGSFLGLLVVVISRNLTVLAGVSVYWKDLVVALVLLASVLVNRLPEVARKQTKIQE